MSSAAATSRTARRRGRASIPTAYRLAVGPFVQSQATGTWQIFHPSGNLAAEGRLTQAHGMRDKLWHFYYDTPNKTPIAIGAFAQADLTGMWQHFDSSGHLLATEQSSQDGWLEREGVLGLFQLDIVAAPTASGTVFTRATSPPIARDSTSWSARITRSACTCAISGRCSTPTAF